VPTWADDPRIGNRLINARAETVATSPAFRRSFTGRRCIVPADAFYEWQRVGEKTRRPFLIRRRDGAPLAFAGLWSTWRDEAHDAWLRSFTIITTDANRLMAQLHDRMPVVLEPRDWAAWLDPEVHDADRLRAMLHPAAEGVLEAYAVSPLVNSPRNLGPELIRPVDDEVLRD
jgi:putative SOS response-associated peptidase YedK